MDGCRPFRALSGLTSLGATQPGPPLAKLASAQAITLRAFSPKAWRLFEAKEHERIPPLNAAGPAFARGFGAAGRPSGPALPHLPCQLSASTSFSCRHCSSVGRLSSFSHARMVSSPTHNFCASVSLDRSASIRLRQIHSPRVFGSMTVRFRPLPRPDRPDRRGHGRGSGGDFLSSPARSRPASIRPRHFWYLRQSVCMFSFVLPGRCKFDQASRTGCSVRLQFS